MPRRVFQNCKMSTLMDNFFASDVHSVQDKYFDKQIKKTLHLDVYAYRFPHDQGYQIIRTPKIEILILQYEKDEQTKNEAICEFLNLESITMPQLNQSKDKYYADKYQKMRKTVTLSQEYLDLMYQSKYATHFYSSQQIQSFRDRWSRT